MLKRLGNRKFVTGVMLGGSILALTLTFFGVFIVEKVGASDNQNNAPAPAAIPRLADKLQNQVNGALAPEMPFNFDQSGNPFADPTNVAGSVKETAPVISGGISKLPSQAINAPMVPPSDYANGTRMINNSMSPVTSQMPMPVATPTPVIPAVDTKNLLAERNRLIRQGKDVGEIASYYSISEVRPIGIIGSGNRNKVWLYAPATKEYFTVRRGTKFRDGTIDSFTPEGVQFVSDNGRVQTARFMKNSEKSAADKPNPDAPILRDINRPQTAKNAPEPRND